MPSTAKVTNGRYGAKKAITFEIDLTKLETPPSILIDAPESIRPLRFSPAPAARIVDMAPPIE